MSEIIYTWINTEVDLSKKIKNIEEDFSNGYLLGELLNKFNQLTNFKEFKNKDDRESKLSNFEKLETVFRNMQIKFNSKKAEEIINKQKGKVLSLLYQIKMTLEKKGVNIENVSLKNSAQIQEIYNTMKFSQKKESFDAFNHKHYMERLQAKTKSQKDVNLEKSLAKYEQFKQKQDDLIEREKKKSEDENEKKRKKDRDDLKAKNQRQHAFNQTFEQEGIEKWKQNLLKKKEMEKKELDYQYKEAVSLKTKVEKNIILSEIETKDKIEEFEKNFSKILSGEQSIEEKNKNKNANYVIISENSIQVIKEKIMQNQNSKRERDRRRRKIIVDQGKAQLEIENKRREEQLTQKLFKQSNQEKQISYETYRIDQNKNIIKENRKLRDEMYLERKEIDIKFNEQNQEEFLKMHIDYFHRELQKEEMRKKELEISLKQKQRSKNTDLCKLIVNLIIDITEESYKYQQINDTDEPDPRVWREWMQLFENNTSICDDETKNMNKALTRSIKNSQNNENENLPKTSIHEVLDDCELFEYLNFQGQWNQEQIPKTAFVQINLNELFAGETTQAQPQQGQNKNKPQANKDKDVDIIKEEDVENLIIPQEPIKNTYFGDLIDNLIDMIFGEAESPLERNKTLSQIGLKLMIIGHSFAGKKTQAKILSENFPLKIYHIDDLVKKSLDLLVRFESPIAEVTQTSLSVSKKNQIEQIKSERMVEEAKYAEINNIAKAIRNTLVTGEAVPDELYVNLLLEYIKIDFPEKEEERRIDEIIEKHKRKKEILEELDNLQDDQEKSNKSQLVEQEQSLNQELMKINLESSKGFIVVDFPNTYNQAKLLEKKLSGYIPEIEKPKTKAQTYKEDSSILLDKSYKPPPPKKMIVPSMDLCFYLDVPSSEAIRRAIGRRIDPETQIIYHLEDNLPSVKENRVCENLRVIDDPSNSQSSLVTRHLSFENSIGLIRDYFEPFGFHDYSLKMMHTINGNKQRDYVTQDLIDVINLLIKINDDNEAKLIESKKEVDELDNIENEVGDVKNETTSEKIEVKENSMAITNKPLTFEEIKKLFPVELSDILMKFWFKIYENYIKNCKSTFQFLRKQREMISEEFCNIQQKFIEFVKRPNKKQILVLDYQLKYNKFLDDYPDLKDDPQVKDEHHQNVDDLSDKIFEIIEQNKNESIDDRKRIMNSGWIENEMEKFYSNCENLMQNEIDKFIGSMIIIRDYYYTLDNRVICELPIQSVDILKEEIDPTPLENDVDKSYPRVEKLYKNCLKVQFTFDDALIKAEREKNMQNSEKDNKTAGKKPADKKKNVVPENVEEKKEVFKHEEEMKRAIKNEKSKYRNRITLLKYWALNNLKNMRKIANLVYNKLEDWIILSNKAEIESLNQLILIIRKHIEDEQKIKYELELKTFDTIINMDIQNYIEPPPTLLPAKEIIDHSKFNILQLKIIYDELKLYEISKNYIRSSVFIEIFIKKHLLAKQENDVYYGIPTLLKDLSYHNFYKFIKYLDNDNKDLLNLKLIGTVFCLLNSKVCGEFAEDELRRNAEKFLNDNKLDKNSFIKIPMWFDQDESCLTLKDYEDFKRTEKLKEVIFDINKEDNELVDFTELLKIFTLADYKDSVKISNFKTYYETLFF